MFIYLALYDVRIRNRMCEQPFANKCWIAAISKRYAVSSFSPEEEGNSTADTNCLANANETTAAMSYDILRTFSEHTKVKK